MWLALTATALFVGFNALALAVQRFDSSHRWLSYPPLR
jgi:hypothetical protein